MKQDTQDITDDSILSWTFRYANKINDPALYNLDQEGLGIFLENVLVQ